MAGRPPKTTAQHKADGTYRHDRHGGRLEASIKASVPRKARTIDDRADEAWRLIVETLPAETLSALDSYSLRQVVRWYAVWEWYDEILQADPTDEVAFSRALKASEQFNKMSKEFGLTPAARAKIKTGGVEKQADPFAAFASLAAPTEN